MKCYYRKIKVDNIFWFDNQGKTLTGNIQTNCGLIENKKSAGEKAWHAEGKGSVKFLGERNLMHSINKNGPMGQYHYQQRNGSLISECMFSYVQLFVTPWAVALHAPLSIEFSR